MVELADFVLQLLLLPFGHLHLEEAETDGLWHRLDLLHELLTPLFVFASNHYRFDSFHGFTRAQSDCVELGNLGSGRLLFLSTLIVGGELVLAVIDGAGHFCLAGRVALAVVHFRGGVRTRACALDTLQHFLLQVRFELTLTCVERLAIVYFIVRLLLNDVQLEIIDIQVDLTFLYVC